MKKIALPLTLDVLSTLKAGDEVLFSGIIYTARDQAHKRLDDLLQAGRPFPVDLNGQIIYYVGPTPAPDGSVIGSCGPTTSKRMDPFTPQLLKSGVKAVIGKGPRSAEVVNSFVENKAAYFYAYGGCGALYQSCVTKCELVAFPDLGPEAIYRLEVKDFPVITAIDLDGNNLYHS